ncbi:MAG: segregation/condensation protein A, partial [Planctomycetes bacterium]|nr:segregation/condensation protein A [Planctomycetota bacterium]
MVGLPSEFRANLESYNGPLDLLLFLIKKDEIDVFDIPIAEVIVQYQVYLSLIKDLNPNLCGDFLVMAARLMEIKSKLLLPRQTLDEEEEGEDPRMELVRQLLEYKKFKERAILLEKRLDLHRRRYRRPSLHQPAWIVDEEIPLDLGKLSVWDLLTAFHKVEIALGQRGPHQVVMEDRPLEEYIRDVVEELESRENRTAPFEDLFRGARNRYEALSYFLAILQLAKDYRLYIDQEEE